MIFVILCKLTETIVHLCCEIIHYLITIFLTQTKRLLFELPFNLSTLWFILCFYHFVTFLHHPIHLKRINESMQSNLGLPNTHDSLSAYCSVTAATVGCCQFLQTTAIYSADWFISSVSPPSSLPHAPLTTRSVRAHRARTQDRARSSVSE